MKAVGFAAAAGVVTLGLIASSARGAVAYSVLDIGTLGGSVCQSSGYGGVVNNFGQVVGSSMLPNDSASHGFRTAPNSPIDSNSDLGTVGNSTAGSSAISINDSGYV